MAAVRFRVLSSSIANGVLIWPTKQALPCLLLTPSGFWWTTMLKLADILPFLTWHLKPGTRWKSRPTTQLGPACSSTISPHSPMKEVRCSNENVLMFLIHPADPETRLVMIIIFTHVCPYFSKLSKTKQLSCENNVWHWRDCGSGRVDHWWQLSCSLIFLNCNCSYHRPWADHTLWILWLVHFQSQSDTATHIGHPGHCRNCDYHLQLLQEEKCTPLQ